ncbi:MAG TPA: CHAD domain-containing protein [Chloroflexota bacterium]|nr:CHAD domain-containing protein [Chloroflexota bacterium]
MAPARKIALRCRAPLLETARTILGARIEDVEDRRAAITGPTNPEALHALRIAAKRLRYSLETFDVCFPGNDALIAADRVRALQDILGRIHDLDVLDGLLVDRLALMDDESRRPALEVARTPADDESRRRLLTDIVSGRDASARLGLLLIIAAKADERRMHYAQFETLWQEWETAGFLGGIQQRLS